MCLRQRKPNVSRESQPTGQREEKLALKAKYLKMAGRLCSETPTSLDILMMNIKGTHIQEIGAN